MRPDSLRIRELRVDGERNILGGGYGGGEQTRTGQPR